MQKKKKKEAPSHSYLLTSSPSDGNHNKKAVLVFAVSLSHPSKDLPRPRHFLHPWQHQSEGQQRCTCIHQVHGAVKHQVPNRDTQGSFNTWTHAHFNDMATKQGSRWFWQHYPQVFVKYLHSPAGGVVNCLWDRCNNTSHQQRGPKTYLDTYTLWKRLFLPHLENLDNDFIYLLFTNSNPSASFFTTIYTPYFSALDISTIRYLPYDWSKENTGAVGQRSDWWLCQHDPRQHRSPKTEEHGAEPAG